MALRLGKESIDIGIVVRDEDAALKFYRDTLGLEHVAETPVSFGGTMHRLMCGNTVVKVAQHDSVPEKSDHGGGPRGATGIRYWTITVENLDELAERCRDAGYALPWEPMQLSPGVRICMVEDPEGNWVELLQSTP